MRLRFGIVVPMVVLLAGWLWPLPSPTEMPPLGLQVFDRHGRLLYQALDPERGGSRPVALRDVASSLVAATIAVEDASFWSNPGVDPVATARALAQNVQAGEVVAGGSTVTQQLARLRYLPMDERVERSVQRKLLEAWLAVRLTNALGKEQVLEAYLNSAPYGNLAVGIEAAAWTYFGKPARELSLGESALLAGLPQSPTDYDPFTQLDAARARQGTVLALMARHWMISEEDAQRAGAEPPRLNPRPYPMAAAHFVELVRDQAPAGAVRVWTTLDADLQAFAQRAAERQVARLVEHDVGNAAVVVLDVASSEVRAMVGGVDYFDPERPAAQVNMAITPRQPGSAFKPIVYAAALESGRFTLASVLRDERTVFVTRLGERYVPENYDRQFHGEVPLRVALASSFNVPAVAVADALGVPSVLSMAGALGLAVDPSADLGVALGSAEVPLLNLTAAYAALARGGEYQAPVLITRAEDAAGVPLHGAETPTPQRVLGAETAWLLDDVLSDDAARAPGFGRDSILHLPGKHVAAKTGTTSDYRDNWTVGFTSDVAVGVWVGNPDNRSMRDVSGVSGAAPLWRDVMDAVVGDALAQPRPAGLRQASLCALSEELAGPKCPARRLEWLPLGWQAPAPAAVSVPERILYPDMGSVIVPDPQVPSAVPIEVDGVGEVLVNEMPIGTCAGHCVLAWQPRAGSHVVRVGEQTVRFQVVPSSRESPK